MRLLVIGGSDAGIAAGLRARELDPAVEATVVVTDAFPTSPSAGWPTTCRATSATGGSWPTAPPGIWNRPASSCSWTTPPARSTPPASRSPSSASAASGSSAMTDSSSGPGQSRSGPRSTASTCPGSRCCIPWPTPSPSTRPDHRRPLGGDRGGGYIGREMAEAFCARGLEVTWLSRPQRSCPPSTWNWVGCSARSWAATPSRSSTTSPSRPSTPRPAG